MTYQNTTLADLKNDVSGLSSIINKYSLSDTAWQAKVSEVCESNAIDPHFFEVLLHSFSLVGEINEEYYKSVSVDSIIDYLEKTHHHYINKQLPEIEQTMNSLLKSMDDDNPLFVYLLSFLYKYKGSLIEHVHHEEKYFFPYIKALLRGEKKLNYTVEKFTAFHQLHEIELSEVLYALEKFDLKSEQQFQFNILISKLNDFQRDLQVHEFIEDIVLVNKALALEKKS